MKNHKTLIAGLALALTFGTVSLGNANGTHEGHDMGMMAGQQMMRCGMMDGGATVRLTADQQKEAQAIEASYTSQREALDAKMTKQRDAMHTAMAKDATTVGTMKGLRQDMMALHQERRALQQKIDQEISAKLGVVYTSNTMPCSMGKGGMQMGQMMGGGMMNHGGAMNGKHCRM